MNHNPFPNYVPRPGGAEYRVFCLTTEEGWKQAETLKEDGWAIAESSLFRITLWRPKNVAER
jgi:hypothetical protein